MAQAFWAIKQSTGDGIVLLIQFDSGNMIGPAGFF
jgi:hypothetical protein